MDGDRKSVEPMSEKVHASERGMQRLLTEAKWDRDGAFGKYRRRMLADTADPQGILVIDDTGFPKKGRHSVCVSRQYCGSLGKVDNCQIGVSLTYVGQGFAWPYAMELFILQSWDNPDDPECVKMRKKTYMSFLHSAIWRSRAYREKKHTAEPVVSENGNGEKQSFPMNPYSLESWKYRQCPVRSSSRWRNRQRELKQKSSLPDVRHQIALYLMRMLI